MSKNKNIDYDLIIKVIQNELIEVMEADYNYYKDYNVKISREQFFIEENDKGKNNIYITVRFGQSDVNFGQSVLPLTFTVMAEQTSMQVCQDLLYSFAETFDLKRVENDTILQIYTAPQITTNFYEVFTGFQNILSLSGSFVISQNANLYTISLYDETKLAIHKVKMTGGLGYTPINSESTFLTKISSLNLLNVIDRKPIDLTFNYNPLNGNEIKDIDISTLLKFGASEIIKYDNIADVGDKGTGTEMDTDLFNISISQSDTEDNEFISADNIVEFNNNLICSVQSNTIERVQDPDGYYLVTLNAEGTLKYANKGLSFADQTIKIVVQAISSEGSHGQQVVASSFYGVYGGTIGYTEESIDTILVSLNPTFTNSWEMVYNNTTTVISDITEYGFNNLPLEAITPSKVVVSVYYKPAELEKYDYNVPFITTVVSGNFQLDTQAFYDNNNYTESQTQVGTRTLSITTFLLDDIELANKMISMMCEELSVNTPFYMSINYKNGKTYYGIFKAVNFTQQENISEIPVYNVTFTN